MGGGHLPAAGWGPRLKTLLNFDAQAADVMLVAEWHRLGARHAAPARVGRALQLFGGEKERRRGDHGERDRQPRDGVRAAVEYLGQLIARSSPCWVAG